MSHIYAFLDLVDQHFLYLYHAPLGLYITVTEKAFSGPSNLPQYCFLFKKQEGYPCCTYALFGIAFAEKRFLLKAAYALCQKLLAFTRNF